MKLREFRDDGKNNERSKVDRKQPEVVIRIMR